MIHMIMIYLHGDLHHHADIHQLPAVMNMKGDCHQCAMTHMQGPLEKMHTVHLILMQGMQGIPLLEIIMESHEVSLQQGNQETILNQDMVQHQTEIHFLVADHHHQDVPLRLTGTVKLTDMLIDMLSHHQEIQEVHPQEMQEVHPLHLEDLHQGLLPLGMIVLAMLVMHSGLLLLVHLLMQRLIPLLQLMIPMLF